MKFDMFQCEKANLQQVIVRLTDLLRFRFDPHFHRLHFFLRPVDVTLTRVQIPRFFAKIFLQSHDQALKLLDLRVLVPVFKELKVVKNTKPRE